MHLEKHMHVDWTNGCVDGKETNLHGNDAPGMERHDTTWHRRTATCADKTWMKANVDLGLETMVLGWNPKVWNGTYDACWNPAREKFGEWTRDEDVQEAYTACVKDGMLSCRINNTSETTYMVIDAPETRERGAWGRSGALVQLAVGNYAQLFIAFVGLMLHMLGG